MPVYASDRHCERNKAIQALGLLDCFASHAMTMARMIMHQICLTRQPHFRYDFDTMHEVHQSHSESAINKLGLGRNEVRLVAHDPKWEKIADITIGQLWKVFGDTAVDIQHVGSTSIKHIMAKPDMVVAVGVRCIEMLNDVLPRLHEIDIEPMKHQSLPGTVLCALTSESESGVHSLYVHIVEYDSTPWRDYISFRDYMNAFPEKAAEYEKLKIRLAKLYPDDRKAYKAGKMAFFNKALHDATP